MPSHFASIESNPPIEVWRLIKLFKEDTNPNKVNLGIGVYQDDKGKTETLPVVRYVEQELAENNATNKMYLEHTGLGSYCDSGLKLVLGEDSPCVIEQRAVSVQSLGGTGGLRIGFEFLYQNGYTTVYLPTPTWPNHAAILQAINIEVVEYRYWNSDKLSIDIDGLLEDLSMAPPKSVILLHACAHNPTGSDPTREQWMKIGAMIRQKEHIAFFDLAYQGFSTGDLDEDAWAIRYFAHDLNLELFVAQSFSKNFVLYSERVGQLIGVFHKSDVISAFQSQVTTIIWSLYLTPPDHGARVVSTILNDPILMNEWKFNVKSMSERIKSTRYQLYTKLRLLNTPGNWEHIITQTGMFAYTGLTQAQCRILGERHSCYLTLNGRINVCAITTKNVDYIAEQIYQVLIASEPYIKKTSISQHFAGEEFTEHVVLHHIL
ncbi:unnamed protein product [Adineta steineri]|uniref:aspartate transaminase n=1 Tax=Adineta steineri TaxID=433720 RepID=A0A815RBW6_9BILA|nr:unnamed protein product [Adineta steineri]CAF4021474.1 unnamed protein product [Adineta steineri]